MVKVKEDMTGWIMSEHGVSESRWTVIRRADDHVSPNGERYAMWLCECSCKDHTVRVVRGKDLRNGDSKSCGCLVAERMSYLNKKNNKYDLTSFEYGVGWTTNTNKEFYFDLDDYQKISNYTWYEHVDHNEYHSLQAHIPNTKTSTMMHWIIMGKHYDHKDRNPFNNRKENLRKASFAENAQNSSIHKNNTSGFTGVHWDKTHNVWIVQIGYHNKRKKIGSFVNKKDAVIARLKAELEYFGPDFAPQRHLFKKYGIIR